MFEKLFTYRAVISRHKNAPFARERENYLIYRAKDGTSKGTLLKIARELRVIVYALNLCSHKLIGITDIEKAAVRWSHQQQRCAKSRELKHSYDLFFYIAKDWLHFIGRLQSPNNKRNPYYLLIHDFTNYMKHDRELSTATIKIYLWYVKLFFSWFCKQKCSFSDVSILNIDQFIKKRQIKKNWSRVTCYGCVNSLRTFFRYAEQCNLCTHGIADAIESPRIFKQESLPTGPDWVCVQKLIASTETNNAKDIRDRAILILFSVYGFRSSEVAQLQLKDLDWQREIINIYRPKQRIVQSYPFILSAGEAILKYLKDVRPKTKQRNVFLTLRAPFRPLSQGGMYQIVSSRIPKLGIKSLNKGPHSLRHACATHLVSEGLSLKEIGDHLGHRSAFATRIYAKVDFNGLRIVANFDIGDLL